MTLAEFEIGVSEHRGRPVLHRVVGERLDTEAVEIDLELRIGLDTPLFVQPPEIDGETSLSRGDARHGVFLFGEHPDGEIPREDPRVVVREIRFEVAAELEAVRWSVIFSFFSRRLRGEGERGEPENDEHGKSSRSDAFHDFLQSKEGTELI